MRPKTKQTAEKYRRKVKKLELDLLIAEGEAMQSKRLTKATERKLATIDSELMLARRVLNDLLDVRQG